MLKQNDRLLSLIILLSAYYQVLKKSRFSLCSLNVIKYDNHEATTEILYLIFIL